MNRIILTIGYISSEWVSASDGSTNIQVGDLDHNQTSEHDFEITDDDFINLTNGNSLSGSTVSYTHLTLPTKRIV